jgi:succinyl-CoA synthetase alpha subunit
MSILVDERTKLVVQGLTGREAQFTRAGTARTGPSWSPG